MLTSAPTAPTALRSPLVLVIALLGGCAATGVTPTDGGGGPEDGGVSRLDAGPPAAECAGDEDCPSAFVCAAVMSTPRCVANPNPPPPGDGTDCSPCPAPGECRMGLCIQPTSTGELCEFDSVCEANELCIAGRCTPDPRIPVPCTDDSMCPFGLTCGPAGVCICTFNTDCPSGLLCVAGTCDPGDRCIADAECDAEEVCDPAESTGDGCRPRTVCDIAHPSFSGTWNMHSVLHIREALPDWLDGFLRTVEGPFRFLAGDATCIDFGLPGWVETEICDLVRPFVDEHLPPWSFPVFRAIADLNDVLSTWTIEERMELTAGSIPDSYRGTHEWLSISMDYRGMPIEGTPESILDWRFAPSPFNASAVCGTFHIERHDVNVSIGSIIAWLVDTLVYELSEHRWATAAEALTELAGGFCDALADAADAAIDYDVRGPVSSACRGALSSLIDGALREILESRLGASPITLRGRAPVTGPDSLRPGTWNGTLLSREFPGEFTADR